MLRYLTRANTGPLSAEGLAEIYAQICDLLKADPGTCFPPLPKPVAAPAPQASA